MQPINKSRVVIDIGSASVRLYIAQVSGFDHIERELVRTSTITLLGKDVEKTGELQRERVMATLKTIDVYLDQAAQVLGTDELVLDEVICTLTSAARSASNSFVLIDALQARGLDPRILSGAEEGRFTFIGATSELPSNQTILLLDIGGGSTELVFGKAGAAPDVIASFDVGCARILNILKGTGPYQPNELDEARAWMTEVFERAPRDLSGRAHVDPAQLWSYLQAHPIDTILAVGGTATTLVAIKEKLVPYDSQVVHGYTVKVHEVQSLLDELATYTLDQKEALPGLQPQRAPLVVPGGLIMLETLRRLNQDEFIVWESDLLQGLALGGPLILSR